MNLNSQDLFLIFAYVFISLSLYFLPWLIAFGRHKCNAGAIFILNLFLGWTLVGWVIALVWAFTHDPEKNPFA